MTDIEPRFIKKLKQAKLYKSSDPLDIMFRYILIDRFGNRYYSNDLAYFRYDNVFDSSDKEFKKYRLIQEGPYSALEIKMKFPEEYI